MKKNISNIDLLLSDLPDPTDINAVFEFAMTFDGYEYFGSFEAASANGKAKKKRVIIGFKE